jgi:hypothetical protein
MTKLAPQSQGGLPFQFYRHALLVYPRRLRLEHRAQMLQTLSDAYRGHTGNRLGFWLHAYRDLIQSSFMERIYMVQERAFRTPVTAYTLVLAAVLTLMGFAAALTVQQMLRRGANQPQIDMAAWYAGEIAAGEAPGNVIPPGYVDLDRSLQPFVIYYDEQGKPSHGTGYLDQQLPAPPAGVFDFARSHGIEKVTWQPRGGVRIASVVQRVGGKGSGFVLAGRSLRLVEEQESLLWRMALGIWITIMALLALGVSFINRAQRSTQVAT